MPFTRVPMVALTLLMLAAPALAEALSLDDEQAAPYTDGALALNDGPSKPVRLPAQAVSAPTGPGNHATDSFFFDVLMVRPAMLMSCPACVDPITTTPEPTALLLFGTTLAGIGLAIRWRLRRTRAGRST